ncbi:MAG: oligosaccharide flippase family protein [bacterium]|nr:oligosaccharide flippase family protein [bacterium]
MDSSSLTFRTLKNTAYNIVGYVWPMLFALIITPIIVFRLGIKEYGIFLFVSSIISLLGVLDLGLGTAITKYVSHHHGRNDAQAMRSLIYSSNTFFLIVGIVGYGLMAMTAIYGPEILPSRFDAYKDYSMLFAIAGGIFFFNTMSLPYNAILQGMQRFDLTNKINIVLGTLGGLTMLMVVLSGMGLTEIFFLQLTLAVIMAVVSFIVAKTVVGDINYRFWWDKTQLVPSLNFGLYVSAGAMATSIAASLNRIVIPFFVGPSNLTYYNMPNSITSKIPGLAGTVGSTIFPTTSELHGANASERIVRLYVRSMRLISVVSAAIAITCIAFAYELLFHWLNQDFADRASNILIISAIASFVLALYSPLYNFLLGLGKIRFITAFSIAICVLNILLLFIFLPLYGIIGVAWAQLFSLAPMLYMLYHTEKHFLRLNDRKRHYRSHVFGLIVISAIVWSLDSYVLSFLAINLPSLLIICCVSVITFLLLYKAFGLFEREDWDDFEHFFTAMKNKLIFKKP